MSDQNVTIDYTNWRGERRKRQIRPIGIQFGNNEWHTDTQWILYAYDVETKTIKSFAMADIHSWKNRALGDAP